MRNWRPFPHPPTPSPKEGEGEQKPPLPRRERGSRSPLSQGGRGGRGVRVTKSPSDRVHGPLRFDEAGRVDLVALPLVAHVLPDHLGKSSIVRGAAQQRLDIHLVQGKQAVAYLAIGG